MTIYIVKKHRKFYAGWYGNGHYIAFEIHSTHHTREQASLEAKIKNRKAQKYLYIVGKVEVKETP